MNLKSIYLAALEGCAPGTLVREHVTRDMPRNVVAIGKCAGALLDGVAGVHEIESALVAIPEGYRLPDAFGGRSGRRSTVPVEIHVGGHPTVYFGLYRLLRTRQDLSRAVTSNKQVVIEGFPRSGNSFARRASIMAQNETFDATRIAHHLHVPAQVVRAAQ